MDRGERGGVTADLLTVAYGRVSCAELGGAGGCGRGKRLGGARGRMEKKVGRRMEETVWHRTGGWME